MNIVGFTGTRNGMTKRQEERLISILNEIKLPAQFHHGDCIGSDAEAHDIASKLGYRTIAHPGTDNTGKSPLRAYCKAAEIREARPYLLRNMDIVDEAEIVIATPKESTEQRRSGTWQAIRYARRKGKKLIILSPEGKWIS